jgi:hypothetical protein
MPVDVDVDVDVIREAGCWQLQWLQPEHRHSGLVAIADVQQ